MPPPAQSVVALLEREPQPSQPGRLSESISWTEDTLRLRDEELPLEALALQLSRTERRAPERWWHQLLSKDPGRVSCLAVEIRHAKSRTKERVLVHTEDARVLDGLPYLDVRGEPEGNLEDLVNLVQAARFCGAAVLQGSAEQAI